MSGSDRPHDDGKRRALRRDQDLNPQVQALQDEVEALRLAVKRIDKAAAKGVIHKNNASRRKGRLMKKLAAFVPDPTFGEEKKKGSKKSSK
mgnify:CR=1 FL=1